MLQKSFPFSIIITHQMWSKVHVSSCIVVSPTTYNSNSIVPLGCQSKHFKMINFFTHIQSFPCGSPYPEKSQVDIFAPSSVINVLGKALQTLLLEHQNTLLSSICDSAFLLLAQLKFYPCTITFSALHWVQVLFHFPE